MIEDDQCRCGCHEEPPSQLHMLPCCRDCPHCGKRIREEVYERHAERCARERRERVNQLMRDGVH